MHALSILKRTPPNLLIHRLSIPYTPPPQAGQEPLDTAHLVTLPALPLPTGEVIEHPFKNFGYQLYFQNPQSTIDIQANVCASSISRLHVRSNTRCFQLDKFLYLLFQTLKSDNTLHIPITEATMDGLNVVSTQISDAVTGKTPVDPNLPIMLTHEVSGYSTELVVLST